MEGYCLIYRNQDGNKVWSKRYFTIRDNLLVYSRNPGDKSKRKIQLDGATIEADQRRSNKCQFVIRCQKRGNYYLRAMNADDLEDWIADLQAAAGDDFDDEDYGDEEEDWDEEGDWDEEEDWEEEDEE